MTDLSSFEALQQPVQEPRGAAEPVLAPVTPRPVRQRPPKRLELAARHRRFIAAMEEHGVISRAARAAGWIGHISGSRLVQEALDTLGLEVLPERDERFCQAYAAAGMKHHARTRAAALAGWQRNARHAADRLLSEPRIQQRVLELLVECWSRTD